MKMLSKTSVFLISLTILMVPAKAIKKFNSVDEVDFNHSVSCLKEREVLEIGGKEYIACKDLPKLFSELYGKDVSGNPCYANGQGPRLLKLSEIESLPHGVKFGFWKADKDQSEKYITVRFISSNNLHWENVHASFSTPYWHHEENKDSVMPIRSVNFLLMRIDPET